MEPEDCEQGILDRPHFVDCERTHRLSQPLHVNRTNLLNEHTRRFARDVDLGSERCGLCAPRRWSNDHYCARQQLIGLQDNSVSHAVLFVPDPFGHAKPVDVTTLQPCAGPEKPERRFVAPGPGGGTIYASSDHPPGTHV